MLVAESESESEIVTTVTTVIDSRRNEAKIQNVTFSRFRVSERPADSGVLGISWRAGGSAVGGVSRAYLPYFSGKGGIPEIPSMGSKVNLYLIFTVD